MTSSSLDGQRTTERLLTVPDCVSSLGPKRGWLLLLAIVERVRTRGPVVHPIGVGLDAQDRFVELPAADAELVLDPARPTGWSTSDEALLPDSTVSLLDLFVPLCVGTRAPDMVVAHLAQTLDGRVATNSGSSQFISGREDLTHTHRLRALFDGVLVGARTVEHDDPRLTTRLAPGPNPTRIIVDPTGRLPASHRVFQDGDAPTLVVRGRGQATFQAGSHVEVLECDVTGGWIAAPTLLEALAGRGLRRVFIEGGGVTVSGFLDAGVLDRLHLTVAPVLMGSGRPSLTLPEVATIDEARRLSCRHFSLGPDILFDCELN